MDEANAFCLRRSRINMICSAFTLQNNEATCEKWAKIQNKEKIFLYLTQNNGSNFTGFPSIKGRLYRDGSFRLLD